MLEEIRVSPTPGAHTHITVRLLAAKRSYKLLSTKADMLKAHFKKSLALLIKHRSLITEVMKEGSISLAEVTYITGSINQFVLQSANKAMVKVWRQRTTFAGVNIPSFEYYEESLDPFLYIGLARGGQKILKVKNIYRKALKLLIKLASLQSTCMALLDNIRTTNRRVNVLFYIIIPRFQQTLQYITSELEEYAREETFRLKKIQAVKRRSLMRSKSI